MSETYHETFRLFDDCLKFCNNQVNTDTLDDLMRVTISKVKSKSEKGYSWRLTWTLNGEEK